jgi:hypothetical protein
LGIDVRSELADLIEFHFQGKAVALVIMFEFFLDEVYLFVDLVIFTIQVFDFLGELLTAA